MPVHTSGRDFQLSRDSHRGFCCATFTISTQPWFYRISQDGDLLETLHHHSKLLTLLKTDNNYPVHFLFETMASAMLEYSWLLSTSSRFPLTRATVVISA